MPVIKKNRSIIPVLILTLIFTLYLEPPGVNAKNIIEDSVKSQTIIENTTQAIASGNPLQGAVAGYVKMAGKPAMGNSGISIRINGTNLETTTDASGFFIFDDVSPGNITLVISHDNYLQRVLGNITISAGQLNTISTIDNTILLWAGDLDGINGIGPGDLNVLISSYGKTSGQAGYNNKADFDEMNGVGASDLNLLLSHYGRISSDYPELTVTSEITPINLEIESVSSTNLKEVVVTFNKAVDTMKGTDKTNYIAKVGNVDKGVSNVKLSADKATATLLLTTAISQLDKVTVLVNAALGGIELSATSDNISDTALPRVVSIVPTGNKLFRITYSEPVQGWDYLGNYTLDGVVHSSLVPTLSADGCVVTLSLVTALEAKKYIFVINNIKDYAQLSLVSNSTDIVIGNDTIAPNSVSLLGDASQTSLVVKFNEEIQYILSVSAGANPGSAVPNSTDKSIWTVTFPVSAPIPAATTTVTFTDVTDYSGNKATLTISVTPLLDVSRPVITGYKQIGRDCLVVEFSKNVIWSSGNYNLKDKEGNLIVVTAGPFTEIGELSENMKKVQLKTQQSLDISKAPYTLAISEVADYTPLENVIIPVTISNITLTDLEIVSITSTNLTEVVVLFNKAVDSIPGSNLSNYIVKVGNTDKGVSNVKLSEDNNLATLRLTNPLSQLDRVTVTVKGVIGGNETLATSNTIVDTSAPTVKSVICSDNKHIQITFSEPVLGWDDINNYTFDGVVYPAQLPTLSADGHTVSLTLTTGLSAGVHKVVVLSGVKDFAQITIASNTTDITITTDEVPPVNVTVIGDASQTKIIVRFNKAIEAIGRVNAGVNTGNAVPSLEDKTVWIITFPINAAIPIGTSNIILTDVTDFDGNKASLEVTVTPVPDITRPLYVGYKQINSHSFYVEYSEEVNFNSGSYTLKDKDGKDILVTANSYTEDNGSYPDLKKVLLTTQQALDSALSPYSLKISGVTDYNPLQNIILEKTITDLLFNL